MKVLVLGSGPAGLIAAHTASMTGADVLVYSKGDKSPLYGCQYLHAPIPYATRKTPVRVNYVLEGTADGYAYRVYGEAPSRPRTSVETLTSHHDAWDIRDTYDWLWMTYGSYVQPWDFTVRPPAELVAYAQPDLVVSSIPANLLCRNGSHRFDAQEIWAMGDAPDLGQEVPYPCPPETVLCNGHGFDAPQWYRISNVFGYKTVEWPGRIKKPPMPGVARVKKPLLTNCDCEQFLGAPTIRVGRYGSWRKGVLAHEAEAATLKALHTLPQASGQGALW